MTQPTGETLPPSARELDRERLLQLDEKERADRLQAALCDLYLMVTTQEGEEVPTGELDRTAPLILESFVASDLHAILDAWLGVTLPVSTLLLGGLSIVQLSDQLIEGLAAGEGNGAQAQHEAVPPARLIPEPAAADQSFPLAEIQEAYWIGRDPIFELGNVSAHLYTEFRTLDFDIARAERALQRLIDRHEMLRSVVLRDGRQKTIPEVPPYRIEVVDLSTEAPSSQRAFLAGERARMIGQQTRPDLWRPFDVRVFRLDERRSQMNMFVDMVKIDAWSVQLLISEWFALYEDPGLELPAIGLTFRDYVAWTREHEASSAYQRARRYWLDRIASLPPAPELPWEKPFSDVGQPRFTPRTATLDRAAWERIKGRAAREGLTPSTVVCAAYAEVLGRWSRHQRFTLSVASGRPAVHPEISHVVGPFARPMLLEVDGTVPGAFVARARALRAKLSRDLDNLDFGGLAVLRELARSRGLNAAAMPVIFTSLLPQGTQGGLSQPDWWVDDPYVVWGMPQLVLENQIHELDGALVITWVALEEVFPLGLLDELFDTFQRLLERLADDPDAWLRPYLELRPSEQLARRAAANRTTRPVPDGLLHTALSEQLKRRPDEPAVISPERTLTYAELDRLSRAVAGRLARRGVRPNTLVGVCMEKGWEQVVAVLGVLRAGAAYLPVDPDLPPKRRHAVLADGEVELVLTQPHVNERLVWPEGVERLTLEPSDDPTGADDAVTAGGRRLDDVQRPDDLAYVIYTSGSTGQPKGVMIDHRGALNTILDVNRRFLVGPSDRVLGLSALSFDLSVYDIFGPLVAGGTIVLPDQARIKDPEHWAELIRRNRVTVWNSVPALMEMLVEYGHDRKHDRPADRVGSPLRLAMLSGDWIPVGLPERIREVFPGVEVVSLGGATEASIWSIVHPIREQDSGLRSIPYGLPLANQRFHVLNERLEPCPDLVAGELFIAGTGLAKGYWRDDEKTKAAFFAHPITGEPLYKTGDVGRYLPNGEIEFLGREDSQVKVSGYRIELGEIETVLEAHPDVRSAVATARGARDAQKALAAYVVLADREGTANDGLGERLRAFAAERLPDYAVPTWIVELDELPLTPNGKVDRSALPDPTTAVRHDRAESRPPRTELERRLAGLWQELLGVDDVGIDDDFATVGGVSIHAVRLASRAEDAGIPLRSADIIAHPTIAELAAVVERRTGPSPASGAAATGLARTAGDGDEA